MNNKVKTDQKKHVSRAKRNHKLEKLDQLEHLDQLDHLALTFMSLIDTTEKEQEKTPAQVC